MPKRTRWVTAKVLEEEEGLDMKATGVKARAGFVQRKFPNAGESAAQVRQKLPRWALLLLRHPAPADPERSRNGSGRRVSAIHMQERD